MKKGYTRLGVIALLSIVLAACSNNADSPEGTTASPVAESTAPVNSEPAESENPVNETGYPISKEPINLSIMVKTQPDQGAWKDLWISKHLNEMLGGTLDAIEVDQTTWGEKLNLAFATGEMPDLFMTANALSPVEMVKYGSQGLLIPLNDLIEKYAPNIKKMLEDYPDLRKSITAEDGNIYALPNILDSNEAASIGRYWINKKWLDKLGLQMPTTAEEFYKVLKAFKEQDPNGNGKADEIPATGSYKERPQLGWIAMTAFGQIEDTNAQSLGITLDKNESEVLYAPAQPEFKEYYAYMNRLYKEGLIDPAYYTQNTQEFRSKVQSDLAGFFFDDSPAITVGLENDRYKDYVSFAPLTSEANDTKMWPIQRTLLSGGFANMAITSTNKHPEATMRLFDYASTKEGGLLIRYGPEEGVIAPGAGTRKREDGKIELVVPSDTNSWSWRMKNATNMSLAFSGYLKDTVHQPPEYEYLRENLLTHVYPYGKKVFPSVILSQQEQETVTRISTDLKTYVQQMEARFIIGDEDLSGWDKYLKTIEEIGSKELVGIYQAAYDRWNK